MLFGEQPPSPSWKAGAAPPPSPPPPPPIVNVVSGLLFEKVRSPPIVEPQIALGNSPDDVMSLLIVTLAPMVDLSMYRPAGAFAVMFDLVSCEPRTSRAPPGRTLTFPATLASSRMHVSPERTMTCPGMLPVINPLQ